MRLLDELKQLPSIPETTGLTVWLYGGQPGPDPEDAEQVEAARVLGGVLSYATLGRYVRDGAMLAEKSGAQFGLRHHPWYKYDHPPQYRGREYHDTLHRDRWALEQAKVIAGDMRVERIEIDVETWKRDDGLSRQLHNDHMADNHAQLLYAIRDVFPNADVGWYGYSPKWRNLTLTEETTSASLSMYHPLDQRKQEAMFNQAVDFAYARGLGSVTVWVTLSAGYDGPWNWELNPGEATATWLGKYLARGDHLQVHNIVIYDAFDPRATHFREHLAPFLKALLGT